MLHMKRLLNQTESPLFVILCVACFQRHFLSLFYSTVAGDVPCGSRKKSPRTIIIEQVIFYFLWDHWAHPGYFENRTPLKPVLGGVCSLADCNVAYEETQSNRVSIFVILCVLCFQRQSFFTLFYSTVPGVVSCSGRKKSPRTSS